MWPTLMPSSSTYHNKTHRYLGPLCTQSNHKRSSSKYGTSRQTEQLLVICHVSCTRSLLLHFTIRQQQISVTSSACAVAASPICRVWWAWGPRWLAPAGTAPPGGPRLGCCLPPPPGKPICLLRRAPSILRGRWALLLGDARFVCRRHLKQENMSSIQKSNLNLFQ